jgi:hypothetical protein
MLNRKIKLILNILALTFILLIPGITFAQNTNSPVNQGLNNIQTQAFPGQNGQTGANTVVGFIAMLIKIVLFVSGALAVLFVIIGGIMYLTSAGNEEQATKGKKTITYALVGIIIIILSYVIVNVVVNLVNCGLTSGGAIITGC